MMIHRSNIITSTALLAVLIMVLSSLSVSASDSPDRISIACSKDMAPFHFMDESGQPAGIMIDIWRLWSEKTGIPVGFQVADWNETLTMVGSGTADVHAGLFFNKERDKYLDYGLEFMKMETHFFQHMTLPSIKEIDDLAPYRIGVIDGDYVESYLKERLPQGNIIPFANYRAMMDALHEGTLKVFAADTLPGLFYLDKNGLLSEFTFNSKKPLYQNNLFFAVQEGDKALVDKINQGMALITDEEKRDINRRWIVSGGGTGKTLIISIDRDYAPMTFINPLGRPSGLFVDMWRAWAKKTGQQIQFRASNWAETLEGLRAGEADIHSGLSFSDDRDGWIDFSTQIYETYSRVYHRVDDIQPATIEGYQTNFIGVIAGTYQEEEFRKAFPSVTLRSFATNPALIEALLEGKVKAIVEEEQYMEISLGRQGLSGDITARSERILPSTIHAGILKGNTELLEQIDNGFAAIEREKLADLEERWVHHENDRFYQSKQSTTQVMFTDQEIAWLEAHSAIHVGIMEAWPPMNFLDDNGVHSGIGADYLALLNQRLGNRLVIEPAPFKENFEKVKNLQLDALMDITPKKEREAFFEFTRSYMTISHVYVGRKDAFYINSAEDLFGKSIALEKGYYNVRLFRENYPQVTVKEYLSTAEALEAVSRGEAEAYVGNRAVVAYLIEQELLSNLVVQGRMGKPPVKLNIGVRKDWPILASILDRALAHITLEEVRKIHQSWIGESKAQQLGLSNSEEEWLATHREFKLGIDPSWAPFEFMDDNGKYSGVSSGYVRAVSDRLEIGMTPVEGLTWSQVVEKAKAGEIDILPAVAPSSDRETFLNFTNPYISLPIIIAVHEKMSHVNEINDLVGYRVGVVRDYFTDESLSRDYPKLSLIKFSTLKEGLQELNAAKLDAFVDSLAAITDEITVSMFGNIKISAPTEYKFDLAFGVRNDWPSMVSILNKTIDDISDHERMLIKNTWMAPVEVKYGIDLKKILMWAVPIGLSVVLIILLGFIWNRRLSNEVIERKRAEDTMRESEKHLKLALKGGDLGFWDVNMETYDGIVNERWAKMLEYSMDEIDKPHYLWENSIHPDDRERVLKVGEDYRAGRLTDYKVRYRAVTKEGNIKWFISEGISVEWNEQGFPLRMVGTVRDITDRKTAELAMQQSEAKYRELVENANSIIIKIDRRGRITFFNEFAQTFFGFKAEEIRGKNAIGTIIPEQEITGRDMNDMFRDIVNNPERYEFNENENIRKNGERVWVSWTNRAVLAEDGQTATELLCIGRDITERKQMEDELFKAKVAAEEATEAIKESERRIKSILDSINTGIIIIDPDSRTIVDANPIAERMIGLSRKEIVGNLCHKFICPREMNDCPIIDHAQTVDNADRVLLNAEGQEIPILKTVVKVKLGGKLHFVESFVDLTERKQAEEALRRNLEELEQFNQLTIGREEKMIELKIEINQLMKQLDKEEKYEIVE